MTRRHLFSAALGLSTLLALLSTGCGGGGGGNPGDNSDLPNPTRTGGAEGYAFLDAAGAVVLHATKTAGEAAGLRAAGGVRAEIVGGSSTRTGADGLVRLSGIAPGLHVLRLTPSSGGGASTEIRLTVVPDAILPLGQFLVTRQAASDAVRALADSQGAADLFANADIMVTATPLPAGVVIQPAVSSGDAPITLARPSWVVYVDTAPEARFGHDTALATVDAETGEINGMMAQSWHTFNGANFYAVADVNATSPDALVSASRSARPPRSRAAYVPQEIKEALLPPAGAACRAKDPEESRTHVLVVQGDAREDFSFDLNSIGSSLRASPFPPVATMREVRSFESSLPPQDFLIEEFNRVRDAAKSGDTFVFCLTAHGYLRSTFTRAQTPRPTRGTPFVPKPFVPPPPEEIAASYQLGLSPGPGNLVTTYYDGGLHDVYLFSPTSLDFGPCKACRIILWIDTCYSGNWITLLRPQLDALEHKDIQIVTSSDQQHEAQAAWKPESQVTVKVNGETVPVPLGGAFSQSLILGLSRVRQDTSIETGADAIEAAFSFAASVTKQFNLVKGKPLQNPQPFRRPLEADDVCGRGSQAITVK